ncbi:MAG: pimeloyl-ACP methyl ester esterase BioH [Gammaproteobacteria bacterium]|nr:pimeloyl-ACP methyl ester esterase BioH [Gammaproteobacteria bacterium]MBU1722623.1 pimeloyl-ACP methyl ester esterase BioH [Gammaproteobacteria bacterium]MBU2006670.1 pimeloyl-ACP methyl ester esterase BioH [Gammaproteobacteria bacterium]
MNALYTNIHGQGRPLVLLHGWGMNSHVWEPVLPELQQIAQVTCIDLPGHGKNSRLPLGLLETAVDQIADHIPQDAIIMGWSLGGLIAQGLAHALPKRVAGLIQIASTPKFVADAHWRYGLAPDVLANFASNLQTDYQGTVRRFFALQFLGVKTDSRSVNALRERIMQHPASMQALEDGLNILASADFARMPVKQSTVWMLGRLDKLIPPTLADALPEMGYKHIALLNSAAHVPFATHPELFMEHVRAFLDEH